MHPSRNVHPFVRTNGPICAIAVALSSLLATSLAAMPTASAPISPTAAGALSTPLAASLSVAPQKSKKKKKKAKESASEEAEDAGLKLPLEKKQELLRTFEATVDEATWLSSALSPDGNTLVIEVLGDLYSLPASGGTATPLSGINDSMGFDAQPTWSPDGQWLAFISDRDGGENLYIVPYCSEDCAGDNAPKPKQLTKDIESAYLSPVFSADGEYVVVSRAPKGFSSFELWMYHVKGGAGIQVTKANPNGSTPRGQRVNAFGAAPSPDGRYLYFAARRGGFQYNASFPLWQITRRDLETGDEDVITTAPGSAMRPLVSPDGKLLAYATRVDNQTALKVRDLATGEERWAAFPVQRDEQESRGTRDNYPGYSFTPDSSALITTWGGKLHRVDLGSGASSEIPFEVSIKKLIGPELHYEQEISDGPFTARLAQGATVSPDAQQVAFSTLGRIYVADLPAVPDGDPTTELAEAQPLGLTRGDLEAYQPAWSPDGQSLAFVTWSREGGHIYTMASTGGTPRRLTSTPAFYAQPTWSPDGQRVVALRGARQDRVEMPAEFGGTPIPLDLVWLNAQAGATPSQANLVAPARGVGKPHFTADPNRIYVHSPAGLQSMRFDGSDRRTHIKVTGTGLYASEEPVPAGELRISPDGKWVLASVSNRFFLIAVPKIGGEAPTVNISSPGVPTKRLSRLGADSFGWSDNGETIHWSVGAPFSVCQWRRSRSSRRSQRRRATTATVRGPTKKTTTAKRRPTIRRPMPSRCRSRYRGRFLKAQSSSKEHG